MSNKPIISIKNNQAYVHVGQGKNRKTIYDIFTLMNRSFALKVIFLFHRRNLCRRPGKCDALGKRIVIL